MFSNGKCMQSMYKVFAPQDNFCLVTHPEKQICQTKVKDMILITLAIFIKAL